MTVKKYKTGDERSYALGITLTIELLNNRPDIVKLLYLHSEFNGESRTKVEALCRSRGVICEENDKVFNILSDKDNCFCIGVFNVYKSELDCNANHIVLVNPSNAGNLGTILRSCLGFNIHDVAIISPSVDVFDPKTVRASMGAVFSVNVKYYNSFEEYVSAQIDKREYYSFMLQSSSLLTDASINSPYSLIFGNEATGLPDYYSTITKPLRIGHSKAIDSLNLQTAVSIALFYATKGDFN